MSKLRKKVIDALLTQIREGVYRPGQRLPTLMELTGEFGVSRGTVCNALDALIEQGVVVKRHGCGCFLSESAAIEPQRGRKIVFLGAGSRQQIHYMKILEGIEQEVFKAGYEIAFFNHDNQPEKAEQIVAKITPGQFDGVIFMPLVGLDRQAVNLKLLGMLDNAGCRYVTVDTPILSGSVVRGNFVGSDNYNSVRRLIGALIAQGYRKFGSIRVFDGDGSSEQRFAGLIDQLQSAGVPVCRQWHEVIEDVPVARQGRSNLHRLLALPETPEIIFCTNDCLAGNVLEELQLTGIAVPEQMAVCGFDGGQLSEFLRLTTVRQDFTAVGARAAQILFEAIGEERPRVRQEFMPCEPVFRNSTGSAAAAGTAAAGM